MQLGSGKGSEGSLVGRAVGLPGLAEYQEGSIVSRTLVNKKAGTVTLFAFDKGQDPEHLLRPGMSVEPDVRVR